MKFLFLSIVLGLSLIAGELTLQSGSISGLTGVLGDSKIDPKSNQLSAQLSIDGDELTSIRGSISVEMAFFKSENADRDENMHETLQSEKFKTSTYTITSVEATKTKDTYILKGELDFHGVKKEQEFNALITQNDATLNIDAKANINFEDYEIEMPCLLGFTMCVDENVAINGIAIFNKH
ncbi:MAG: YceI family protein [Thiovulaceae bacterium]|jgi:polyisoprenoid-binding protein YceI|nr:YceI family protein [Sulfurimonadaceae bacterium]MCW9027020.1 YceI family protein [Sulfurimonadaceae bacterium]